jgi:hypothetical protein
MFGPSPNTQSASSPTSNPKILRSGPPPRRSRRVPPCGACPQAVVILQESDGSVRQIFTDGRKHTTDPQPSWMGYSVGRWEGDSLVVDTVGFNDLAWLDASGHPRSEAMRVTERYHRRDFGHLDLQITLDDPKIFTRVFSIKYTLIFVPDSDVAESVCSENEKDRPHITK